MPDLVNQRLAVLQLRDVALAKRDRHGTQVGTALVKLLRGRRVVVDEHKRGASNREALRQCLPEPLRDATFSPVLRDDAATKRCLAQLLLALSDQAEPSMSGYSHHQAGPYRPPP